MPTPDLRVKSPQSRPEAEALPSARKAIILAAVEQQGCNITSDIAVVTGLPRNVAAAWVSKLVKLGLLRHTGHIKRHTGGCPAKCFEVTP